jgi:hypothetical protein
MKMNINFPQFRTGIIVALTAVSLTACTDILDQIPSDRYNDAIVWNDEALITQHLAQLYAFTPVMVQDCSTSASTWDGATLNRDDNSWSAWMGQSEQMEGPTRALEISDECMYNFGAQANFSQLKSYGYQVNDTYLQWWGNAYYQIRNLNNFMTHIETSTLGNKAELKGEARFLRAFCYFAMVKRYGGVPLIKDVQPISADSATLYPVRNSEQQCYDFIIDECLKAVEELPETNEAGRATKWAAYALLSRASLFAGSIAEWGTQQSNGLLGFPKSDANKYYQICVDACNKIISSGHFGLYNQESDKVQNYRDIFLKKDNNEAILVWRHSGPDWNAGGTNLWSWDMCECPRPNVWGVSNYDCPYLDLVEAFERVDGTQGSINRDPNKTYTMQELFGDRDPRLAADIWTNDTEWPKAVGGICFGNNHVDMHRGIMKSDGVIENSRFGSYKGIAAIGDQLARIAEYNLLNTGFGVRKYLDDNADVMSWFCTSTTDYLIFRYAEILLNQAEAAFELKDETTALKDINLIRERAGIAQLGSITRDQIRHERQIELCFENHRYWDLRRWRTAEKTLTTHHQGLTYVLDPTSVLDKDGKAVNGAIPKFYLRFVDKIDGANVNPVFPAKNYYWPIGNSRIAQNPNLVENPGYAN